MAAADAELGLEEVERFDALSQEIETRFNEFHNKLETRKAQLLDKVREMKELYERHRDIDKSIEQMEIIRKATSDVLTQNLIAGSKNQFVSLCDDRIYDLGREKENLDSIGAIKLVLNSVEVSASIDKIHLRECGVVEFNKRREPLIMTVGRGEAEGELVASFGIAVDDQTDLVYVTNYYKCSIFMYSLEGDYIKSFGEGKLTCPHGICVSEEFVFVNSYRSIVKFYLNTGEFVCDSNSQNQGNQLDYSENFCLNSQTLYVCNSGKHRIDLFNLDLLFLKSIGESQLKYPRDIKIHKDSIFVLDDSILTFNAQHEFIRSIQLIAANITIRGAFDDFFAIDLNGNFIIGDKNVGGLRVFSPTGRHIDSLGDGYITVAHGVTVDRHNRIVSVSSSLYHCLQIY